jgi:hypothetical protein
MKAKRKHKPAQIERLTTTVTMSDGRKFTILDIAIDTLTVYGQLYAGTPVIATQKMKIPNRTRN